ncbi:hypothetical protein [Nocardia vulneris]|uniref:hypothetical protein n=1 Tax=Nocardia TaxID=1817 RepID=UPI0005BB9DD1|nr:hypothetical protein [Nocardia vulneris]
MGTRNNQTGRHRLGMAGGVHCTQIPAVAEALAEHRRTWFTALISPARHSFAAMRKRSTVASVRWVPATAS